MNLPTTYTHNQLPVDTNEVATPKELSIFQKMKKLGTSTW